MGSSVTAVAAYQHSSDPTSCTVNPMNYRLGLAMYTSYFVLFAMLYYNLYLSPNGKHAHRQQNKSRGKSDKAPSAGSGESGSESENGEKGKKDGEVEVEKSMCGVDLKNGDAAGFFHPSPRKHRKMN